MVQVTRNLEKRYRRISRIITTTNQGKRISHSSLFTTRLGKKLGKNIDIIQEFALKGTLTVFPFNTFIQALERLYSDNRYLEELRKSGASESDIDFVEFARTHIIADLEANESNQLFNKADERILMGTLTTSLYALIDGYSMDALSLLINIEGAPRRILRNLNSPLQFSFRDVEGIVSDPDKQLGIIALDAARVRSIKDRFRLMKSGTGIWDCIQTATNNAYLSEYERHFEDFIDLRHKIAHQFPIPKPQKFLENALIREFVDKLKVRFRQSLDDSRMAPEVLSNVFTVLMDWFASRQTPIGIILQLTTMAAIYPAIIDNAIGLLNSQ